MKALSPEEGGPVPPVTQQAPKAEITPEVAPTQTNSEQ